MPPRLPPRVYGVSCAGDGKGAHAAPDARRNRGVQIDANTHENICASGANTPTRAAARSHRSAMLIRAARQLTHHRRGDTIVTLQTTTAP
eukprot:9291472-Pyramimonas_sp.AAC.1